MYTKPMCMYCIFQLVPKQSIHNHITFIRPSFDLFYGKKTTPSEYRCMEMRRQSHMQCRTPHKRLFNEQTDDIIHHVLSILGSIFLIYSTVVLCLSLIKFSHQINELLPWEYYYTIRMGWTFTILQVPSVDLLWWSSFNLCSV